MKNEHKILIAYFSRKGGNYVSGSIVNLTVGNTEVAAKAVAEITGGKLFEIKPDKQYPADYRTCTEEAQEEQRANARPALAEHLVDFIDYDVIFLGYPNWWGTMPMPVWTFLEEYDFSGKVIVPFCTHEGSGMGRSERDITKLCPCARIEKGHAIHGAHVKTEAGNIRNWINKLDL